MEEPEWSDCRTLRALFAGGEALDFEVAARHRSRSSAELINLYGPTEAAIDATFARVTSELDAVPVGVPLANVRVYVVDGAGRLAPVGVAGEVWIAGAGVARGYLGLDALTAERFVDDPFADGGRADRTGDIGRWRQDGVLELLGRVDDQVKIRGHRVELGEIEAILREVPEVRAAAVVADGRAGAVRLIAYVVLARSVDARDLRRYVEERLPDAMSRRSLRFLGSRYCRAASLTAARCRRHLGGRDRSEYADETERRLAAIWQDVLNVDHVVVLTDNFTDLGGDSLHVMRIPRSPTERTRSIRVCCGAFSPFDRPVARTVPARKGFSPQRPARRREADADGSVAVIGLAGRFPGAPSVSHLWEALISGKEMLQQASESSEHAGYVPVTGKVARTEFFDCALFGLSPQDAAMMDPQHRALLEVSWKLLRTRRSIQRVPTLRSESSQA